MGLFVKLLEQITPTDDTIKLFKEIVRRTAARKLGNANREINNIKEKFFIFSTKLRDIE